MWMRCVSFNELGVWAYNLAIENRRFDSLFFALPSTARIIVLLIRQLFLEQSWVE